MGVVAARFRHVAILRWAVAIIVIVVVGIFGLSAVFSDLGPGESAPLRILFSIGVVVGGGLVIGLLLRSRWYLAVLESWGPVLWGALIVMTMLDRGRGNVSWLYLALCLVVTPALALLGGYLGWRISIAKGGVEVRAS